MTQCSLADLHEKIMEIAVYFDKFCRSHGIIYYLMGGSALGAIRHNGFIPWDDDFDVFMTCENYKRFIDAAEKDLDREKFYLQKEDTEEWPMFFSKLRLNNTTCIEPDTAHRRMHKGVFIDIMCLNNVFSNAFFRYVQYVCALSLSAMSLGVRGYHTNTDYRKHLAMVLAKTFVRGPVKAVLLHLVRLKNDRNTHLVGHFFGKAPFIKTSFPKEILGRPRYVSFENARLPVPEKVEEYLKLRYGDDFMKLPDEKTRSQYRSHACIVDLEKDFTAYD